MLSWEALSKVIAENFWAALTAFGLACGSIFFRVITSKLNRKIVFKNKDGENIEAKFKPQQADLLEGLILDLRGCTERHTHCEQRYESLERFVKEHIIANGNCLTFSHNDEREQA